MIEVCHIDGFDTSTQSVKTLRVTSSSDYIANGEAYLPVLAELFDYSESLFDKGTTHGQMTIGVGTVVLNNADGALDYLSLYGFDGRAIKIYKPASKDDTVTDETNLFFTGVIQYAELGWNTITFYIKSRLEIINVPMQKSTFLGTNIATGGDGGFEGSEALKGKTKPQIFGRCQNVSPALINDFYLIYAFNYDKDGNFAPLYRVYDVYVKGIRYLYSVNYATPELLLAANMTALGGGYYATCLASGLIRLSSVPADNGAVVANVATGTESECNIASVVTKILTEIAQFVPSTDYVAGELAAVHNITQCAAGISVTDNSTTIADAINQLLGSGDAWAVPDSKGVFRFGVMDFPDVLANAQSPVCTITKDQWGASIERAAVQDEGQNVPAYSVELKHTRNWTVQQSGGLADAVSPTEREFFTNEYRSTVLNDANTLVAHPLAPSLVYETLLNGPRVLPLLNGDFYIPPASVVSASGWYFTTAQSNTRAGGFITIPNAGGTFLLQQKLSLGDGLNGDVISGDTLQISFSVGAGSVFRFGITASVPIIPQFTIDTSAIDPLVTPTVDMVYDVPISGLSSTETLLITFRNSIDSDPNVSIGNVVLQLKPTTVTLDDLAQKRLKLESSFQERFTLDIPLQFYKDSNIRIGALVTLYDPNRFNLSSGKNFLVIGADPSDSDYTVTLDVWRAENIADNFLKQPELLLASGLILES